MDKVQNNEDSTSTKEQVTTSTDKVSATKSIPQNQGTLILFIAISAVIGLFIYASSANSRQNNVMPMRPGYMHGGIEDGYRTYGGYNYDDFGGQYGPRGQGQLRYRNR